MTVAEEFDLLSEYLHQFIDLMTPVNTGIQINIYRERGYIEEGRNKNNFIPFEAWKRLNRQDVKKDTSIIAFCNWSKEAEWRDVTKQMFIKNDWESYIQEFKNQINRM